MASLIVRNVDESLVEALKRQARRQGLSAEALHRRILHDHLCGPTRKKLSQLLQEIPAVGLDSDFERVQDGASSDVFD